MFNPRWSYSGTLNQICEELRRSHFPPAIFLIVNKGPGWYKIKNDTWLLFHDDSNNWLIYYWPDHDPRPFLRAVSKMEGFK